MARRTAFMSLIALLPVAVLALRTNRAVALGVVLGGLWSLLNFWALSQTLSLWLTRPSSRRRIIGWLLVKFPLLYGLVVWMLTRPNVSPIGVGIGVTIALIALVLAGILTASRPSCSTPAHGR